MLSYINNAGLWNFILLQCLLRCFSLLVYLLFIMQYLKVSFQPVSVAIRFICGIPHHLRDKTGIHF